MTPGIDIERKTITLLHGTTASNAAKILEHGFRPMDPKAVAAEIAAAFGLTTDEVYNHICFEFARHRRDLDHVHVTSDPETARAYTVPEVVQDALKAVWAILHPVERQDIKTGLKLQQEWVSREGRRLAQPEILAVTMPWSVFGAHAFGRTLTLQEWLEFGKLSDLHSKSVPIEALQGLVTICRSSVSADPRS